eukprot:CAMPEP_0174972666 /NCGR_PEP_ID=MMETSP0004_2-20121128/10769_1 /TAXON_ID=420556 /ORGANISM="Ochromonas sp., Strain CCMP1393" /LENGTH=285 /DNA_ID=CAMNT_0016222941 /DNA_START=277 /DNA_END=1134 /DNA_ORIENTATION=+
MASAAFLTTSVVELIWGEKVAVPVSAFWKPALSSCVASPIGYHALKYITYPLLILTKSSKPVPVMMVGVFFYGKKYGWYKYVSVAMLVAGISMFTSGKKSSPKLGEAEETDIWVTLFGIALVLVNLGLDGYTNNEQDHIFSHHKASANQMMRFVNLWQCLYQVVYLVGGYFMLGHLSELYLAFHMIRTCPDIGLDIVLFCTCASLGQILIFGLMKEFGSLVWITISVTRKLFTIFLSVFMFKHTVSSFQWMGVAMVFGGLGLDIGMNYYHKGQNSKAVAKTKKKD